MITTSSDYKQSIESMSRKMYSEVTISGCYTFSGININYINLTDGVSADKYISLGNSYSNKAEISLHNVPKNLIQKGNSVSCRSGLVLTGGQIEWVKLGTFYIDDIDLSNENGDIKIVAYDKLYFMSDEYKNPEEMSLSLEINSYNQDLSSDIGENELKCQSSGFYPYLYVKNCVAAIINIAGQLTMSPTQYTTETSIDMGSDRIGIKATGTKANTLMRVLTSDKTVAINEANTVLTINYPHQVAFPMSLKSLVDYICSLYSIKCVSELPNIALQTAPVLTKPCSNRQMLGKLAGIIGCNVKMNRDGDLIFKAFTQVNMILTSKLMTGTGISNSGTDVSIQAISPNSDTLVKNTSGINNNLDWKSYTMLPETSYPEFSFYKNTTTKTATVGLSSLGKTSAYKKINIPGCFSYNNEAYTVNEIRAKGFFGTSNVRLINIPDTVLSIKQEGISQNASLISITGGKNIESISQGGISINPRLVDVTLGDNLKSIDANAFSDNASLTEIKYNSSNINYTYNEEGDTSDANIFYNTPIRTIYFGDNVQSIPKSMFSSCTTLSTISLAKNIHSIGESAFKGCIGIETLHINSINCTTAGTVTNPAFENCNAISSVVIGNECENIPAYLMYKTGSLISSITISNSVKNINTLAFRELANLTSINFGFSIESIGPFAFYETPLSDTVKIPDSVKVISYSAFGYCTGITRFELGYSVMSQLTVCEAMTGSEAFTGCSNCLSILVYNQNIAIPANKWGATNAVVTRYTP